MAERDLYHRVLADNFLSFLKAMFGVIHPGKALDPGWHIDAMACQIREAIVSRSWRLVVTMPPRSLKSFVFSVALPAYLLGRDPTTKIVVVSYSSELAEQLSDQTRRLMDSALYNAVFPRTRLVTRTKVSLRTSEGGRRFATTIGGSITGLGGEWLIVDDPLNASHAHSDALKTLPNDYFDKTLSSRGDNPSASKFFVVMQRLHENDLAGHLLAVDGWTELRLQAQATEAAEIDVGKRELHVVRPGDLLQPNRMRASWLASQRALMGAAAFEAQYQQNPLPAEGNQIKQEWLKSYVAVPARHNGIVVQSWDTAQKTGAANDYSACTTWLLQEGTSYLIDVWHGKVDYPALRDQVVNLYNRHAASHLLIEDTGSGTALIQDLTRISQFNILPVKHGGQSKAGRVDEASGALESGRVLFPADSEWTVDLRRELLGFPNAKHDDLVDSLTQYVVWMDRRSGKSFLLFDYLLDPPTTCEEIAYELLARRNW